MYGMPGNRFGNLIKVETVDICNLVKEAQIAGEPARTFLLEGKTKLSLSYDGMFLVDTISGEIVDERVYDGRQLFTPVVLS